MSRSLRIFVAVLAAQVALGAVYWLIEHRRSFSEIHGLGTADPELVDGPMPPLSLRASDGTRFDLQPADRRTLIHFWATWCPPCRTELPSLLALPDGGYVDVVAIALDDDWAVVSRFLDGRSGKNVFLGDASKARQALGVSTLPVTLLVESGRIRLRFDGARDWSDAAFSSTWLRSELVAE